MNTPEHTDIHESDDRQDILIMAQRYASAGYHDIAAELLRTAEDLKPTYDRRNSADPAGTHLAEVSTADSTPLPPHPSPSTNQRQPTYHPDTGTSMQR